MFLLFINGLIDWMLSGAVDGWKQACSLALQAGSITSGQWTVASQVVGKIAGVMLFVVVLTAGVAIVKAAVAGRFGQMFMIVGQALLCWPLTVAALWILVQISNMMTTLTGKILSVDLTKPNQSLSLPALSTSAAKTAFAAPLLLIMLLLILLASASIIICMAARTFLLILAVCLIPVGVMNVGVERVRDGIRKYLFWVIGIILYQPLVALLIYITGELMKISGGDTPMSFVMALVGMVLSSVCPWVLVRKLSSVLPMAHGITAAALASRQAVGTTKAVAAKAVSAGVQIAGAAATGGASIAGAAGSSGIGAMASKAGSKDAGATPKVVPESAAKDGRGSAAAGAAGASFGERVKVGLGAASAAMPSSPVAQGLSAAIHATGASAASSANGMGAAAAPATSGVPSAGGAGAPPTTTPPTQAAQTPTSGSGGPETRGSAHVDVHVDAGSGTPHVHVDQ